MKILCVGNSFSVDTTTYGVQIANALGLSDVVVGNLFIGGCPIAKHYDNLKNSLPAYRYYRNDGSGWSQTPEYGIREAVQEADWDWISIQHGSSYGGRYVEKDSYNDLPALVSSLKRLAGDRTKIAFNMTWVGEPTYDRPEMLAFNRDQERYFRAICRITQELVAPIPGIDLVCPTGTAVQNARTTPLNHRLCRDGYHLSRGVGRYLAGMAFVRALTGLPVDQVSYEPQDVSREDKALILRSVNMAMEKPYCISRIL